MANFSELVVKLELQQQAFQKGMDQAARQLARVQQNAKGAAGAMGGLEKGLQGVAQAAAAVGTAFAAIKTIEAITKAADQIRNLQGSFQALLGDAQRAGDMLTRVFGIVERTGAPLEAVGGATQRLIIAMGQLGASNNQIEKVAETFIKLGKVGGSSTQETAAALQQLGQALASGKLGGDELKSIRENAPLVAEAIAQSLNVTSGKLKELGEQGKLTAPVVANALIQAADRANEAFAKLPQTLEQALNKMAAQATIAAAAFDKVGGTTQILVTTTQFIENTLKRWTAELEAVDGKMNSTKVIVESINDLVRLGAVAFVAISFSLEQIVKRTGFWAEQIKLIVEMDWDGVIASSNRFREQLEASAAAANATIEALLKGQALPRPKTSAEEETGGQPLVKPRPITGGGGGGGGGSGKAEADALKKRGEALAAAVNAQNALNQKLAEYAELLAKGAISETTYARAVEEANRQRWATNDAMRAALDPIFEYNKRIEELDRLLQQNVITLETWRLAYDEANKKLTEAAGKGKGDDKEKSELEKFTDRFAESIGSGVGDFFADIISGSKSAEQAFSKMVESIIRDLARLLAELAAKAAIKAILSSFGMGTTASGSGSTFAAPAPSLMLATRPPSWNARASLAGPGARAGESGGAVTAVGAAGAGGSPWNVTINNNAPGVDVSTAARPDGGLEVTIERVRTVLAQDVARGGNSFSRAMESAYGLGRGGGAR